MLLDVIYMYVHTACISLISSKAYCLHFIICDKFVIAIRSMAYHILYSNIQITDLSQYYLFNSFIHSAFRDFHAP